MSYRLRTFYLLIVFFCCMSLAGHAAGATASDDNTKARAVATLDDLESYQKYVDAISPTDLTDLPVGMKKKFGNATVTIGISQAKFLPAYTQLTVFCKLSLPQNDPETNKPKELYFGADNIKLSHGGGLIGDTRLYLLQDVTIPPLARVCDPCQQRC